jgi:peroxiredoxin
MQTHPSRHILEKMAGTDAHIRTWTPKTSGVREITVTQESLSIKLKIDMEASHGSQTVQPDSGLDDETLRIGEAIRINDVIDIETPRQVPLGVPEGPEVGKFAPAFKGITYQGRMVDLLGLEGRKVWLIFYRYATCPLCNQHLSEIERRFDALSRLGIEVIAVFDSAVPAFFKPGGRKGVRFSLISNQTGTLYRLYRTQRSLWGVLRPSVAVGLLRALLSGYRQHKVPGNFDQLPSHFLIDERGIIVKVRRGRTAVDHLPWSELAEFAGVTDSELLA